MCPFFSSCLTLKNKNLRISFKKQVSVPSTEVGILEAEWENEAGHLLPQKRQPREQRFLCAAPVKEPQEVSVFQPGRPGQVRLTPHQPGRGALRPGSESCDPHYLLPGRI